LTERQVFVLGAGKVGSLVSCLLADSGDYFVHLGDHKIDVADRLLKDLSLSHIKTFLMEAQDETALDGCFQSNNFTAVVSCLPYYCNRLVADLAAKHGVNYFDLTEDVEVTHHTRQVSQGGKTVFMPQCGLAPGFVSIAANGLMQRFEEVNTVKMRVGALPVNPNNALKYSLTWSTDGLINEYGNLCYGIEKGHMAALMPLEGYETITLDGILYEAFNTSGGLGTLAETYAGRVKTMNYKTLRYPGHCEKIQLLMNDLNLNEDRAALKRILENAIPKTLQDVVLIYVAVTGKQHGDFFEENYVKKIYPQWIAGRLWSSIQVTTAAGLCCVMDIVLSNPHRYQGFVTQESISLDEFLSNRFGKYYAD